MTPNYQVKIVSWNSRGFSEIKSDFINEINSDMTIICNQENFILKKNSYKIEQCFSDRHVFIKPALKDNLDRGRPRGGMFTAIPNCFKDIAEDISPKNWRVQVIKFNFAERLLLINSYLPVDNRQNVHELLETLEVIRDIIRNFTPRHVT